MARRRGDPRAATSPNAEAALRWIDRYGDRDRDGFQEYATRSSHGYYNQGWKDAGDAIPHGRRHARAAADRDCASSRATSTTRSSGWPTSTRSSAGRRTPAGCGARRGCCSSGSTTTFWWEEEGTYYLGLDGAKQPIRSVASNAGHLLQSGIVPPERAGRVVKRLLADDMWSGWGIRTLSSDHAAYNPFSYHTGTVWPHDNAMIAGGFRRYGFDAEAAQVAKGMFDAAERLVALSPAGAVRRACPGARRASRSSTSGANVPQAWAAGSILRLIAILAGIHATTDGDGSRIYVNPALPDGCRPCTIRNLRAGRGSIDLAVRDGDGRGARRTRREFEVIHGPPPRAPDAPDLSARGAAAPTADAPPLSHALARTATGLPASPRPHGLRRPGTSAARPSAGPPRTDGVSTTCARGPDWAPSTHAVGGTAPPKAMSLLSTRRSGIAARGRGGHDRRGLEPRGCRTSWESQRPRGRDPGP